MQGYLRLFILMLLVLFALCSCSGDSVQQDPPSQLIPAGEAGDTVQPAAGAGLPAFDALPAHSAAELASYVNGCDYREELPHRLVEKLGVVAVFSPDWDPTGSGGRDLAYAIYTVHIDSEPFDPTLLLRFVAPGAAGNLWVALGNHVSDAWDWLELEQSPTQLSEYRAGFDPTLYLSAENNLTVVAAFTGVEQWQLQGIGVEMAVPVTSARIVTWPLAGPAGSSLELSVGDISGTAPYTYAWDFGEAATPSQSAEAAPTVVLGEPGDYLCSVAIDNEYGDPLVREFPFTVTTDFPGWVNTISAPAIPSVIWGGEAISADGDGNTYVTSTIYGEVGYILVQKLDQEGIPVFVRVGKFAGGQDATDLQRSPSGDIYILAETSVDTAPYMQDMLLKLNGQSELEWAWRWESELIERTYFKRLILDGDNAVYIVGMAADSSNILDGILLKVDSDGSLLWTKRYILADSWTDVSLYDGTLDSAGNMILVGKGRDSAGIGAMVVKCTPDGDLLWQQLIAANYNDNRMSQSVVTDSDLDIMLVGRSNQGDQILCLDSNGMFKSGLRLDGEIYDLAIHGAEEDIAAVGTVWLTGSPYFHHNVMLVHLDNDLEASSLMARRWGTQDTVCGGGSIVVDNLGRLYVTGGTETPVGLMSDFDCGPVQVVSVEIRPATGTMESLDGAVTPMPGMFEDYEYVRNENMGMLTMRYNGFQTVK